MKKIFLTGSSGFVRSFFLRNLVNSGNYSVAVLVRNPMESWRILDLLPKVKIIEGDLDNLFYVESELVKFKPDTFVHLAWNGVLGNFRNNPSQWRNVNVTAELVEMAHRLKVKVWVGIGSQAEYGPCENKINECCATIPTTLYGVSKLSAQLISEKLCREFEIRYCWLRLFSSFGPTDSPEWLIPYLILSLKKKEKPKLTLAEQMWDYIYIEDVASAIKAVIESNSADGVFNLGSGKSYKLRTIIEKIRDLIDPNIFLEFGEVSYRPDQVMYLEADITKLKKIGWQPKFDINMAIPKTVEWYLKENL